MRLGRRGRGRPRALLSKRALLKHVNRELWALAADGAALPIYCECGRDDCIASVDAVRDDLAAARTHPASMIVVPEHRAASDAVLARFEGFVVVRDEEAVAPGAAPPRG